MGKYRNRASGANRDAAKGLADKLELGSTACQKKKRAGPSRRLDPVTHMHWRAAEANTALGAALLRALRAKAGGRA
jgi:hypothetical protein